MQSFFLKRHPSKLGFTPLHVLSGIGLFFFLGLTLAVLGFPHLAALNDITSAQSGNWEDPATWVGGVVPVSGTNDVIIAAGHTITLSAPLTYGTRDVTVQAGAVLDLNGQNFNFS